MARQKLKKIPGRDLEPILVPKKTVKQQKKQVKKVKKQNTKKYKIKYKNI